MSRNVLTAAPELQTWSKDLATFAATYQAVLRRLQEVDAKNQDLEADLENEKQSRRSWMKRAQDIESRIAQNQYVLLLIDGNQTCFKDTYIRSGSITAEELAGLLISQFCSIARQQHKNDLARDFNTLINVFLDVERLSQDLIAAGSISARPQLETFLQALTAAHPSISVVDCGSAQGAVDAKLTASYEQNIENCHCRHILLALGHRSDYYGTLEMYSEDEYTKSKTSLVEPEDGFPSKYSLPYHTAQLSVLNTVRLIAFSEITSEVHEPEPTSAIELRSLSGTLPSPQESKSSAQTLKHDALPNQPSLGSAGSPSQHAGSSNGSRTIGSKSSHSSVHSAPRSNASSNSQKAASGRRSNPPGRSAVSHPPQATVQVSAYEEETANYKHDWELRPGENSYAPPAFTAPWGENEVVGGGNNNFIGSNTEHNWPTPSSSHNKQPASASASASRRHQPRQPSTNDEHDHNQKFSAHSSWEMSAAKPAHTNIQTFDGGWDDQVLEEVGTISTPVLPPRAQGPTLDRPIRSEVGLNKSLQRIDLLLQSPTSQDWERFKKRTQRQRLCNEHHLRLACHDRACRYDHDDVDAGLLLALRHTARTSPCDCGSACRRHECYGAHRCPFMERPGGCRKQPCPFRKKGLHNITDLDIVDIIPIP